MGKGTEFQQRASARNAAIVELLRAGATSRQIADEFKLSPTGTQNLCTRLRKEHGIPTPPHKARGGLLRIDKEHTAMLREVERHLGRMWLAQQIGPTELQLDDGQSLMVQQIHAALRVVLLDAKPWEQIVIGRFTELRRAQLVDATEHQALGVPTAYDNRKPQDIRGPRKRVRAKRGAR